MSKAASLERGGATVKDTFKQADHPPYFDCNATTPVEPRVLEAVMHYLRDDYGNAGSRTHEYGTRAKKAVQRAREQVARVVAAKPDEVVFTSGATESNNLAVLGLAAAGDRAGKRHVVTTAIEHKAVLEPMAVLEGRGFEVSYLAPTAGGWVEADAVAATVRPDTWLVSVMHVNNETGVVQPIDQLAELLAGHPAYFHVDAAQGFGKDLPRLRHQRIDLISASGHKVYGPKGVGALVARRREFERPPLEPLLVGGGQERGLRPGTLPVHLIAGLGMAAELAIADAEQRAQTCARIRERLIASLGPLAPVFNGDPARTLPHVVNLSFPGLDSEAALVALKHDIAISNGAACTSQSYTVSHVLKAMGAPASVLHGALRFSWSHLSTEPDWSELAATIRGLL